MACLVRPHLVLMARLASSRAAPPARQCGRALLPTVMRLQRVLQLRAMATRPSRKWRPQCCCHLLERPSCGPAFAAGSDPAHMIRASELMATPAVASPDLSAFHLVASLPFLLATT